jgi:hypothetical protein
MENNLMICETANYSGWKLRYGFLTGNLLAGWDEDELEEINVPVSVSNYAEKCRSLIQHSFPGAEVEIVYQDRSGCLPADLRAQAIQPDGEMDEDTAEEVEYLGSRAFDDDTWQVSAFSR